MTEFGESFAIYATATPLNIPAQSVSRTSLLTRWNGLSQTVYVDLNHGLNGKPALFIGFGGSICKTFSHHSTYTIGFRISMSQVGGVGGAPQGALLQFLNGGNQLVYVQVYQDGSVEVMTNNAGGGAVSITRSAAGVMQPDVSCYFEFTATVGGTVNMTLDTEVWIDNVSVCSGSVSLTGRHTTTLDSGDATFNRLFLFSGVSQPGHAYYSDLYLTNGDGATNTGRLAGASFPYVVVNPLFTRAEGSTLQWTPDTGSVHFSRINENPADFDTSFLYSNTPGQIDTFLWQPLSNFSSTVKSVQLSYLGRSTDEGLRTFQGVVGDLGTEAHTPTFGLCSEYFHQHFAFDLDPATGLAWLTNNFNAKQFGIELIS